MTYWILCCKRARTMNKLEEARAKIEEIDRDMAKLFEARMQAVVQVAEYKKENNIPIFDPVREKALIEKNIQYIQTDDLKRYYTEYFETQLKVSKDYQKTILKLED